MKTETIERYLDECGVTPGKWVGYYETSRGNGTLENKPDHTHIALKIKSYENLAVLTASREMLKVLIESVYTWSQLKIQDAPMAMAVPISHMVSIIESALPGRTWPEIKARLEEIEGEEK